MGREVVLRVVVMADETRQERGARGRGRMMLVEAMHRCSHPPH
jgi:hypothetical protein